MIMPSYQPTENEFNLMRQLQTTDVIWNRLDDLKSAEFWATDMDTVWWQTEYGRNEIQLKEYAHPDLGSIRAAAYPHPNIVFVYKAIL